jgi:COMPASS component SWD3
LHTGQNVLAVRFHPDPTLEVIATGSTDRTAVISNWKTGEKLTTIYGAHTAPVLCLDWNPKVEGRLVMGSVDNSASVVEIKSLRGEKEPLSYEVLARLPIHKKHVVRVAWSPNGKRFATASYDHFVKVLDEKVNEDGEVKYEVIKEIEFAEAVESIVWTPDEKWLIVSARLDNYLHYYDTENWKETKFNMNVAQHDDHVSFTAMDLELSPDGKHLLVSTDKNRMIMFATGTPLQERNFYDVPNGEWCTPRASFNHTGTFVYVSSEDKSIYIYDVATATKRHVLSGHTSNVRDLSCHPCYDIIATASFDKSVKIWQ